jgi:hypothetical protein
VVAVVVPAEGVVAPEVVRVARRLVREPRDLLGHARHHDRAGDEHAAGQGCIERQDDGGTRHTHAPIDRVDQREQRQGHEERDDDETHDLAQAPDEIQGKGARDDDRDHPHHSLQRGRGQTHGAVGVHIGGVLSCPHEGHGYCPRRPAAPLTATATITVPKMITLLAASPERSGALAEPGAREMVTDLILGAAGHASKSKQ